MGRALLPPCSLAWDQWWSPSKDLRLACCASQDCCSQCPWSRDRPLLIRTSTGDSWTLTGKYDSVSFGGHSSFLLGPGAHKVLFVPFKRFFSPQSCGSSVIKSHGPSKSNSHNTHPVKHKLGFPGGSVVKNLLAIQKPQETWVQFLDQKDTLEKEMATHSSIPAWRIPWTEEPGGLQSMGSQRVGHRGVTNTST